MQEDWQVWTQDHLMLLCRNTGFSCCRNLRPGDSLPIGPLAEGLQPIDLPNGWREKYAGEAQQGPCSTSTPYVCAACTYIQYVCMPLAYAPLGRRLLVGTACLAVWIAHQEPRQIEVTPHHTTPGYVDTGWLGKTSAPATRCECCVCFLQVTISC